jgi:hypothetical protein
VSAFSGPNDEFVQPGAWVFDMLRANDWQNVDVIRDRERAEQEAERARRSAARRTRAGWTRTSSSTTSRERVRRSA